MANNNQPRDYNMSGIISKNPDIDKPNANPKWPGYKGQCTINGVQYWISAWVKENDKGKFFSLSFEEKQNQTRTPPQTRPTQQQLPATQQPEEDDEVPF